MPCPSFQPADFEKMEKADILEMAADYLRGVVEEKKSGRSDDGNPCDREPSTSEQCKFLFSKTYI